MCVCVAHCVFGKQSQLISDLFSCLNILYETADGCFGEILIQVVMKSEQEEAKHMCVNMKFMSYRIPVQC